MGYIYNRYKMSTKENSKMSKMSKRKSKTETVGFSKEQKEMLEYMMSEKISECVENIMNSDSEGDDFEGDRDSFVGLFERVFTFKSLKENDNKGDISIRETSKKGKRKKDPNMPKKFKTSYFVWLWNEDNEIGMSKIKNDSPDLTHKQALSKAGEIWKLMSDTLKKPFIDISKKDKERYDNEVLQYNADKSLKETEVVETKKKGKQKKSVTKEEASSADTDEETEVVEPKKKGKQKKTVTKEETSSADADEETEVVEPKKKGKQKKSVTKEEASSADTDEETEEDSVEELDNFERKDNLFLYGYTKNTGSTKFESLNEAVSALEEDEEATGIVKDKKGQYTIRKGKVYKDTPWDKQPEICWKKL